MRIIIHHYADGSRHAFQTTNDGEFVKELDGRRKPGARISAAVEVVCDDNEDGRARLQEALRDAATWVDPAA